MDLLASHGVQLILRFLLFFILFLIIRPTYQLTPTFIGGLCWHSRGNYTENSPYHLNLQNALSNLTSLSSVKTFSNFTAGSNGDSQNKVNALYDCRNDLTHEACHDCVEVASKKLLQGCSAKKSIVLYEECMLRYASRPIVSIMELSDTRFKGCGTVGLPDDGEMSRMLGSTFEGLIDKATSENSSRYYAVEERSYFEHEKIYCLVQCTPDITREECKECLMDAYNHTILCANTGKMVGLLNGPSCQIRYDFSPFYKSSSPLPPMTTSPPPPSRTTNGVQCLMSDWKSFYLLPFYIFLFSFV